jgi:KTSC domain
MDREVVVSLSVRAVGYDRETSTLEIEFCDSSAYQNAQVSEEVYNSLMNSLGFDHEKTDLKYFSEHIKGKYTKKTFGGRPKSS